MCLVLFLLCCNLKSFQSLHFDFILDSVLVPRNILLYQPPSLTHAGWGAEPQEIKIFLVREGKIVQI